MSELKLVSVRVHHNTAKKLEEIALNEGRSQSDLVREMIEHFCDDIGIYDEYIKNKEIAG